MKVFILLLLFVGIIHCAHRKLIRLRRQIITCTKSSDCTSSGPCCRDASGNAIVETEGAWPVDVSTQGTCSTALGGENGLCDSSCGCQTGYTCYRPMSGVCCPPMRCYDATWVDEEISHWANCQPPTCFFPP